MNFLQRMKVRKVIAVEHAKLELPLGKMRKKIRKAGHAFAKALKKKGKPSIIAEFKKASPSRGVINARAGLKEYIRLYDKYADAISILTEPEFFGGKPEFIKEARRYTKKPILRKDFIVDPYEIYEARYYGADAVLLIAGFLSADEIKGMLKTCDSLGMDALVECDSENTLAIALDSGCKILGINNRNLTTMEEDFSTTARLLTKINSHGPKRQGLIVVSESAIHCRAQVDELSGKADAALVGSAIMSHRLPQIKLKELSGIPLVKVCGITSRKDALEAVEAGADIIGLNFYPNSPRYVSATNAGKIADACRGRCLVAGVFVNDTVERVRMISAEVGLDMLQFSGDEMPSYLREFSLPAIKVLHMRDKKSIFAAKDYDIRTIMVDSAVDGLYGGTGKAFDHHGLIDMKALGGKQLAFSGGLDARNVRGIIKAFQPFMVDVCSSVEVCAGVKSAVRMRAFVKSVRSAL